MKQFIKQLIVCVLPKSTIVGKILSISSFVNSDLKWTAKAKLSLGARCSNVIFFNISHFDKFL